MFVMITITIIINVATVLISKDTLAAMSDHQLMGHVYIYHIHAVCRSKCFGEDRNHTPMGSDLKKSRFHLLQDDFADYIDMCMYTFYRYECM